MFKNKFFQVLAVFSIMFFIACSMGSGDFDNTGGGGNIPHNHPIIGMWEWNNLEWDNREVFEFRQNGTGVFREYDYGELDYTANIRYTIKDNLVTLIWQSVNDYSINGNILTIFNNCDCGYCIEYSVYARVGSGSGIVGTWREIGNSEFTIEFRQDGTGKSAEAGEWSYEFTYTVANGVLTTWDEDGSFTYTGGDSFTIIWVEGYSGQTFNRVSPTRSRININSNTKKCENRTRTKAFYPRMRRN